MSKGAVLPSLTDLRDRVQPMRQTADAGRVVDLCATWFAAQTNPRCETKAMHGLSALGFETFMPFGWKWSRPRHAPSGLHVLRRRPAMPGYVFFLAPRDARGDLRSSEARNVDGVRNVVSQNGAHLKIRAMAIELLREAETAGAYDLNKEPPRGKLWDLQPGDRIRITSGVGEGWIADVRRRSNAKEVEIVDIVFGMKLTVPLDRLVPLDDAST